MERKFRPKTGKEKAFQIVGVVCVCLSIPHVIMIAIPVAIIVNFIIALIYWAIGFTFLMISMKSIKARVAAEETAKASGSKPDPQPKPAVQAEKPKASAEPKVVEKPVEKPVEAKVEKPIEKPVNEKVSEPVIKSEPIKEEKASEPAEADPFEALEKKETKKVEESPVQKKSNKALIIVLISVIAVLLVVVILLVVLLKKPSKKAPFDSTSKVYYENGNFIASFSPSGKAKFYYYNDYGYITDDYTGTWDYDESTSTITATFTTMEWYSDEGWTKVNTKGTDYEDYAVFKFEFVSDSLIKCTYSYGYSTFIFDLMLIPL